MLSLPDTPLTAAEPEQFICSNLRFNVLNALRRTESDPCDD